MNKHKKAFTLVELIVVIVIIAILGTIAFIAMSGYSITSRNSVRISDISKMRTSLELYYIDSNRYPDPTKAQAITYSGGLAWYQGIFGNSTFTNVDRLDEIPRDPLTEKEYTYSVLNTKQEYEIAGIMEGDETVLNSTNQVNAAEKTAKAKISGTYNGISLRVNINNTSYILAVPSIITSIDLDVELNRILETIISEKELVLSDYENLPSNYVGTSYDSNKETDNPDFILPIDIVVYEGDLSNLTPTILVTKLQEAYSGTTLATSVTTNELFQIDVLDGLYLETIDNYGVSFINENLGGSVEIRIYDTCDANPNFGTLQTFELPALIHNETYNGFKDILENDGTYKYTINTTCYNGELINTVETGPELVTCDTGYTWNGTICEQQWGGDAITGYLFKNTSLIEEYPTSCSNLLSNTDFQISTLGSPWDGSNFSDGVYWIKPDVNPAFKVYCDMTNEGGGWTLLIMNREQIVSANSTSGSRTTTTYPNYSNWPKTTVNDSTDLNSTLNVVTRAIENLPFQEIMFQCLGDSCPESNNSVYSDDTISLFNQKTGTLTKTSINGWPFDNYKVYKTGGNNAASNQVPIDTIKIDPQCAPASSRPYTACVQIGLVGLDYYSFQNAVGIGIYGRERYSETLQISSPLGQMTHRNYGNLSGNIWIR